MEPWRCGLSVAQCGTDLFESPVTAQRFQPGQIHPAAGIVESGPLMQNYAVWRL
jgi:hypothetical protein